MAYNYLITGGAGFIGSTLANHLSKENSVIVVDDLSMGKQENLDDNSNLNFIKGSVTDKKLMEDIFQAINLITFSFGSNCKCSGFS